MVWIDWLIVGAFLVFITYMAITTQKYTTSVADFLAANRCAGQYLLGTAEGAAAMGAISVITMFEIYYQAGFSQIYWDQVLAPLYLFLNIVGWIIYRFRQTRAMTLAQFFEMRYSRSFRVFAGILAWASGVLNFAIFPAVSANFFINFCGLPKYLCHIGSVEINLTLAAVMFFLLIISLYFTLLGGQIAILVTDFWQGIFAVCVFSVIIIFLWFKFPWSQVREALAITSVPGQSLVDPFDIAAKKDFNFAYFAIIAFFNIYQRMAWQGNQGFNCSAITPHAALMSKIVGSFRGSLIFMGVLLLPFAALVYMNHPAYADAAAKVAGSLHQMFAGQESMQKQLLVPMAMKQFIPVGMSGAFVAMMLCFCIATHNSAMHSWGVIFIQDVVCPLRKIHPSPQQHLRYLRLSIIGVAAFSFFFGLLFSLKEYIVMYLSITGAIYLGGAGAVIVGGLYWKRGTASAAWSAMIVGAALSVLTIILRSLWGHIPFLVSWLGPELPYNSMIMSFWCAIAAVITYVAVSLLGGKTANMDKLLHRGEYAVKEDNKPDSENGSAEMGRFWRMIGVTSREFTKVDKGLFLAMWFNTTFMIVSCLILLFLRLTGWISKENWIAWWGCYILYMLVFSFGGAALCSVLGFVDLRKMYGLLANKRRNEQDDGRVGS
jgi:SSS family solute:Na+ symporter